LILMSMVLPWRMKAMEVVCFGAAVPTAGSLESLGPVQRTGLEFLGVMAVVVMK
jgi:hypothetical protein